jgi:arginyl-tRNA synthetase
LVRRYGKPVPESFKIDLTASEEQELMRSLLNYQETLKNSFDNFKPHILAGYLIEVCHRFGQFYNKCRILGESEDLQAARMTLVQLVHVVLEEGLRTLSIELPEAM